MVEPYAQHQETYLRLIRQQGWVYGLAELLDVPTVTPFQATTQTGPQVAQAVVDYLDNIHRFRQDPFAFLAEAERLWRDSG